MFVRNLDKEENRPRTKQNERNRGRDQIGVPGWNVLRSTNPLCSPRPSPSPKTRTRRANAANAQMHVLRLRPKQGANQCGMNRSENVRRAVVARSAAGSSSLPAGDLVLKMLNLLRPFRGVAPVSQSGV